LFGSILSVSSVDLVIIAALGLIVLSVLCLLHKQLICVSFDEKWAEASGMDVRLLNTILLIMTAVTVVMSMEIAGILLVSSMMVIPASTALLFRKGFKETLMISIVLAVFSVVAGLSASYYFDIAAGGAIVLVLVLMFFAKAAWDGLRIR
jgi:zinc transport system permease protein